MLGSSRPLGAPLLRLTTDAKDAPSGVPEAFPLNQTRSEGQLLLGTPGDHGPTEWSRRGPQVAHAMSDREIDWRRSGAPEASTSPLLERRRCRRNCEERRRRLRILRCNRLADRRLATARPRDSAGCTCVTTRAPREWPLVPGETRQPCREPGRGEGVCRSGGGSPLRYASAPPT